ncbi:MAG: hypothetical protein ACKPKO_09595, partial [Candidatus Fonsibacter sp.]
RHGKLACARAGARFSVMTAQSHAGEALIGEDTMENTGGNAGPPILLPVGVVSTNHLWQRYNTIMKVA